MTMDEFLSHVVGTMGLFATASLELALSRLDYSIPAALFIALALYWHETGRFPIVGLIVRILWIPINLIYAALWLVGGVLSVILGILDFFPKTKPAILFFALLLSLADARFYLLLGFLFLLFWQGVDTAKLRQAMNYYPTAKRTPERPAPRAKVEKPTPPPKLPQRKESAPKITPPPLVTIAAAARGKVHSERQLIAQLPPHLGQLIANAGAGAAPSTRRPSLLKRVLLFPLWLLLLPVRLFRKPQKPKKQPAQAIPATSEASNE